MSRIVIGALAFATALLVVACGSAGVSTERLTDTRAALQAAERVGADGEPQASLYLSYAREQMEHAEALAEEGDGRRAEMMLARAEVDAELAMAMAREARVRREVEATLERIRSLQSQARL